MYRRKNQSDKLKIFVQARTTSTRFPQKVLKEVCGKPMWYRVVTAAIYAAIGDVVLLIPENDPLRVIAGEQGTGNGFRIFEGDEHDVLRRFYEASREYPSKYIMRLTSDCPLLTSEIIREAWEHFSAQPEPYYCNRCWYPDGFDVEIFSSAYLKVFHGVMDLEDKREHVLGSRGSYLQRRYSVDYESDITKAEAIFRKMHGMA